MIATDRSTDPACESGKSAELDQHGQYAYYGKVGGCLVTGNEDGIQHCAMNVLYSHQHLYRARARHRNLSG